MNPLTLNLINRLLSQFNLIWEDEALYWYKDLQFTTVKVEITPDEKEVLLLLGLPNDIGYNIEYDSHIIASSKFFNWKVFKNNKSEISPFLDIIRDFDYKSSNHTRNSIDGVKLLKNTLKYDITLMVNDVIPKDYNIKDIRCKFNGNLVKNWLNITDKVAHIGHLIEGFKEFLVNKGIYNFDYYLYNNTHKKIRIDFLQYINIRNFNLSYDISNDLPF